ncbi:hypothetical protein [Chloracidobacterium thermophilum]|jgi:hypothetical protein|uniref:Uncharacterized protein n=1 Tax=Chloracidobacterium thermophilum (strain B) TaxID=981222 RepID=G2LH93_CHLTF|nr:hypothetical protein [Chloracidobacterium thermophilum]AEP11835.1 hypothetical protein Cabther_A1081 [Chloracidobacterium thermophilum B]QUV79701.1 hypothetical protein J8C08_05475 [Chloracidobacterium thermophilum]
MPNRDANPPDTDTTRTPSLGSPVGEKPHRPEESDDDIAAAIDELIHPTGAFAPPSIEDQLATERRTEAELKGMFGSIVWEFLEPVGLSLYTLADYVARAGNGSDQSRVVKGTVDACIGALRPLIKASETIQYHDILDVLKGIERPLLDVRMGKRTLTERDTKNLTRDFNELRRLIRQSLADEPAPPSQGTTDPIAATPHISDVAAYFKTIDPVNLQRLHAAGITRLGDIGTASAYELATAAGIPVPVAEQVKACAFRAILEAGTGAGGSAPPTSPPNPPPGSPSTPATLPPPVSETAEARTLDTAPPPLDISGEFAAFAGDQPITELRRLAHLRELIQQEGNRYSQAGARLSIELHRAHRALLQLRAEHNRLRGELEFHREELRSLFDGPAATSEPEDTHKHLLAATQQTLDALTAAAKKASLFTQQLNEALTEARELIGEVNELRRRRRLRRGDSREP